MRKILILLPLLLLPSCHSKGSGSTDSTDSTSSAGGASGITAAQAGPIMGDWQGKLKGTTKTLNVILHFRRMDDGVVATLDSPDQKKTGIPIKSVTFDKPTLDFEIGSSVTFEGKLSGNKIEGTWTQKNKPLPLVLTRKK